MFSPRFLATLLLAALVASSTALAESRARRPLSVAVGTIAVEGLDEVVAARVNAGLRAMLSERMGFVVSDSRHLRDAGADADTLGRELVWQEVDRVIVGSVSFAGERGTLQLRWLSRDGTLGDVSLPIPHRRESSVLAVADLGACTVARAESRLDACSAELALEVVGDPSRLTLRFDGQDYAGEHVVNGLFTRLGSYELVACAGALCSNPMWVDLSHGSIEPLTVTLACGRPQVLRPGQTALCDAPEVLVLPAPEPPLLLRKWPATATAGLGLALIVVAGVFGSQASAAERNAYEGARNGTLTREEAERLRNQASNNATLANVTATAGGAALGIGAGLFFVDF